MALVGRTILSDRKRKGWLSKCIFNKQMKAISEIESEYPILTLQIFHQMESSKVKNGLHSYQKGNASRLYGMNIDDYVPISVVVRFNYCISYTTCMSFLPSASASSMVEASLYTRMIGSVLLLRRCTHLSGKSSFTPSISVTCTSFS